MTTEGLAIGIIAGEASGLDGAAAGGLLQHRSVSPSDHFLFPSCLGEPDKSDALTSTASELVANDYAIPLDKTVRMPLR